MKTDRPYALKQLFCSISFSFAYNSLSISIKNECNEKPRSNIQCGQIIDNLIEAYEYQSIQICNYLYFIFKVIYSLKVRFIYFKRRVVF